MLTLCTLMLAAQAAATPPSPAPAAPAVSPCAKPQGFKLADSLSLSDCKTIDPLTVDIRKIKETMRACTLPSGRRIEQEIRSADLTNHGVRILDGTTVVHEFVPEPHATLVGGGGGVAASLACDAEIDRFYFFHPLVGYLAAYDRDGKLLWRESVPDFVSIESRPVEEDVNAKMAALHAWASIGVQIQSAGPYVLVEYRTGGLGSRQIVYHRSGRRVGSVGLWDGRTIEPAYGGWTIVSGGGNDVRYYVPHERETLRIRDASVQSTLEHAFVWLTPRPTSRQFGVDCLARQPDELKYWLKDKFDPATAVKARDLLVRRGQEWIDKIKQGHAVGAAIGTLNPPSEEWQRRLWKAFLEDGLDVQLVAEGDGGQVSH